MTFPESFGNYILLKKIGVGGMAELYLARQVGVMGFERVLAIKRILPHLTQDAEFVQMFINEAKLAAQITHPNVVQIYDFGSVEGTYYMAMEYVMGKSLSHVLVRGKNMGKPMPVRHAVQITAKIAGGLDHAFRGKSVQGEPLGIIHRDISPQNILVAYNGDVKLVDFGIAKAASSSSHTQTGIIKGKLSYLSPEQAWGKRVDHRSDLFSLGIVLHEMLTGERLFKAENEFATLERVRAGEVHPPSASKPHIPKELDPIVLKALAKSPDDRYPATQAFQEALEEFLKQLAPPPSTRDLSDYLHLLYEKEIDSDVAEFKQVTAITKVPLTTPVPTQKKNFPAREPARTSRAKKALSIGVAVLVAALALGTGGYRMWTADKPIESPTVSSTPAPPATLDPSSSPPTAAPVREEGAKEPNLPARPPETKRTPTKKVTLPAKRPIREASKKSSPRSAKPEASFPLPDLSRPKPAISPPRSAELPKPVEEAKPVPPPAPPLVEAEPPSRPPPSRNEPAPPPRPQPGTRKEEAPLPILP